MKKKIMFILCTVIIICMGSLVNAATNLTDIKNTKYENSVNTLITLGLVNGYPEDNTYRPEKSVTRAEMAKLMVVALGEEKNVESAKKETPKFKDVKSSDWEFGYVNLASKLGIINGYPDGSFGPKNTVSYAEATAMIVRALEYEDEVNKSNEVWPNNYMNQAKKLSLYSSVGTVNSNDGAKRGNIAILLWNMLRTGVCTPIGENNNGLIYGEGEILLNKTLAKFIYVENALAEEINFDDSYELAEVKLVGDKTIKHILDGIDATKMYGRKYNVLYNTSTKKVELLEEVEENNVKEGEVKYFTSSKVYVDGLSSSGYKLPDDDNILLYKIDELEDAVTVRLIFSGSTLKYLVAYPPEEVILALVTNTEVTVSSKDGITVKNYKSSSSKSYALAEDETMPYINDVILYYINSNNELVIIDKSNVFESTEIDTANSTKIVAGKNTYKFVDIKYDLTKVKKDSLTSMTVSNIEEDVDSIDVIEFAGQRYYMVYVGGLDEAYKQLKKEIEVACTTLLEYMNTVKSTYETKEKTYTLASFTKFANAYEEALSAKTLAQSTPSIANLNKVDNAYPNLKTAYTGLKKISDLPSADRADENALIDAKIALRNIVNGTTTVYNKKVTTCVTNKDTYTTTSYANFETALNNAKAVIKSPTATLNKIDTASTNLKNSMKNLLTKAEGTSREEALAALTSKITEAEAMKANASKYTEVAYKVFLTMLDDAKAVKNSNSSTEAEIKAATESLAGAIEMLKGNLKESSINNLMQIAREKLAEREIYMTETINYLEDAYAMAEEVKNASNIDYTLLDDATEELEKSINGLLKIDDVLKTVLDEASKYKLEEIVQMIGAMTKDNLDEYSYSYKENKIAELERAISREKSDIISYRGLLQSEIDFANQFKTENDWNENIYAGDYTTMVEARTAAIEVMKLTDATSTQLRTAYMNLQNTLTLKGSN